MAAAERPAHQPRPCECHFDRSVLLIVKKPTILRAPAGASAAWACSAASDRAVHVGTLRFYHDTWQ
jgi:hypothetical protein